MKKRILLMGPDDEENKKILCFLENKETLTFRPSVMYYDETILIPSSYLRSPGMKKHIIAIQQNADCVLMLNSAKVPGNSYSPNFANAFRIPTLGVVLIEGVAEGNRLSNGSLELERASVDDLIVLDLKNNVQCQEFLQKIKLSKEGSS
nr:EutP/PduV family microcompartment system protein [Streptococcus gordonii]